MTTDVTSDDLEFKQIKYPNIESFPHIVPKGRRRRRRKRKDSGTCNTDDP